MSTLEKKQAELEPLVQRAIVLSDKADTGESITDVEMQELKDIDARSRSLQDDIDALKNAKSAKMRSLGGRNDGKSPEQKVREVATLAGAIRAMKQAKGEAPVDGFYAEIHQEGLKEARELGYDNQIKGMALPSMMQERAPINAATAATAGNLIATELYPFVQALRPATLLDKLGVTQWTGLKGNIDIPAGDALVTATYNTETGTASESNPTTKKVTMTPKRLAVWSSATLQITTQSSMTVMEWLAREIDNGRARKTAEVIFKGGGSNEPTGILSMSTGAGGINLVSIGANGGAITRAHLLELEALLEIANADDGMIKLLTTPRVKKDLKNTLDHTTGSGTWLWEKDNTVEGYDAFKSNLLPTNLVKGSSGAVCHPIIFGDWSKVIVGNWGVMDLTIDDVSQKKQGIEEIILNCFNDVQIVHKPAFSVIKDIIVS